MSMKPIGAMELTIFALPSNIQGEQWIWQMILVCWLIDFSFCEGEGGVKSQSSDCKKWFPELVSLLPPKSKLCLMRHFWEKHINRRIRKNILSYVSSLEAKTNPHFRRNLPLMVQKSHEKATWDVAKTCKSWDKYPPQLVSLPDDRSLRQVLQRDATRWGDQYDYLGWWFGEYPHVDMYTIPIPIPIIPCS